jgi:acetyl-CoA acetyltransferase
MNFRKRYSVESLRDKIAVVGIGETEYVRRSPRGVKALIVAAVQKALDDAGLTPGDVDGIVTEGNIVPNLLNHLELAYNLGIHHRFSTTVSCSGGGNVGSALVAAQAITSGQANVILTYYSNNFGSASSFIYGGGVAGIKGSFEIPFGNSGPPVRYAMIARRYMYEYGITAKQLASIAVNQRSNAILNGGGVMKKPLTHEDYEKSPIVADPLRLPDCCLMNDGACAWVTTSAERARNCLHTPVYVMGTGFATFPMPYDDSFTRGGENYLHQPNNKIALEAALKIAGVSREDLDFAEIYDAFTVMLMQFFEDLGFCKIGEGGAFAESGITSLEGALPVNTHGGHLSHSYLNGATHMVEAVRQLRGEAGACQVRNAKIGLVHGGTGLGDAASVIFGRD